MAMARGRSTRSLYLRATRPEAVTGASRVEMSAPARRCCRGALRAVVVRDLNFVLASAAADGPATVGLKSVIDKVVEFRGNGLCLLADLTHLRRRTVLVDTSSQSCPEPSSGCAAGSVVA
jgi:hypothetical protein